MDLTPAQLRMTITTADGAPIGDVVVTITPNPEVVELEVPDEWTVGGETVAIDVAAHEKRSVAVINAGLAASLSLGRDLGV